MCRKLMYLVALVVVMAAPAPPSLAAITPITRVTADHPPGSPPYHLQSITVGNYTVNLSRLGWGTSTTTQNPATGISLPVLDDGEIGVQYSNAEPTDVYTVRKFGGQPLWSNSNGDDPDFFIFEAGDGDPVVLAAILPGGQLGRTISLPDNWGGDTGYDAPSNGQNIVGICFSITDLLDANGQRLTNGSTIEGLAVTSRGGLDPSDWCAVMPPVVTATSPKPADKTIEVRREAVLSWKPAESAKTHDVYFGQSLENVTNASRANPLGVLASQAQDANTYDPPDSLALGQTYYWRIDEVEASSTINKGMVWRFASEALAYPVKNITATASSVFNPKTGPEKSIDGSGLANDLHSDTMEQMWISNPAGPKPAWIQYEFDKVYKLREMWVWNANQVVEVLVGVGAKDVAIEYSTDGSAWTALNDAQFARAPGTQAYAHNTTVDLKGIAARYVKFTFKSNWGGLLDQYGLSEVRFLYVPVSAREPNPAPGATGVNPQQALSWRAGREAASHAVYVSTDRPSVANGTVPAAKPPEPRLEAALDLGRSYYWKVVEANEAETPKSWDGDVWSFTTADALVVDDFESYNDDESKGTRIYETWVDGYGTATNGAQVGALQAPFAERTTIHGGKQSMPLTYNNAAPITVSEATRTLDAPQDWTKHGITTLVLYFYGDPANAAEQMYVKINGTKVLYSGNANALKAPYWAQWNIDLAAAGVNVKAVTKLALGVEGSGKGTVYVDDILLYRVAPKLEEIYLEAEAGTITAPMKTYDDPLASGGRYIGTENGIGDQNNNPPATGVATYSFTVLGGTYKIALRAKPDAGNSLWVRIVGATKYTPGTHASGWIRFNDIAAGANWHWDDVHSSDHNNQVMAITLPAGKQPLEIAYREDGCQIDAILITAVAN